MNFMSLQFQLFVCDSISPQKLAGQNIPHEQFKKWRIYIKKELTALKVAMLDLSAVKSGLAQPEIAGLINQVVNFSNIIHGYVFKGFGILKNHPQAIQIKTHYAYSENLLRELIHTLNKLYPQQAGNTKIPNTDIAEVLVTLKREHKELANYLKEKTIYPELTDITLKGLLQLINKRDITRNDAEYIRELISLLMGKANIETQGIVDTLIVNDFNLPEFYLYCVNNWRNKLNDTPGLHEQRELLLIEKDRLFNLHIEKGLRMPGNNSSLYFELDIFLNEKYAYLKQMVKIRREVVRDIEKAKNGTRFQINLPVSQFGLFIRMQIEKGLLVKEHLGDLFNFFATHFYTPNAQFISAESLQKKSTDVEFATAQKLKGHLIGMLNWLNTNYNLSNYN